MTQAERLLPEQPRWPERVTLGDLPIGIYLPEEFITNEQIEQWGIRTQSGKLLTASDIQKRIGIERRFIAGPNESVIDMGIKAARATGNLDDVYAIFASTSYPVGKNVSEAIGRHLPKQPEFHLDIHAACSGFTRGLAYMQEHEKEFNNKKVLFVTTEKYSHTLADLREGGINTDPSMAQTIFSDGAVAIVFTFGKDIQVLEHGSEKLPKESDNYIRMPIDKTLMIPPFLYVPIPNSTNGMLQQNGPKVYDTVLSSVPSLNRWVVEESRLEASNIKLVIPHQASGRMVNGLSDKMREYILFKDTQDGNFSSASIPKAWARAIKEGLVQRGDKILLSGFGAGLYASSAIVQLG